MNALQKALARLKDLVAELAQFEGKEDLTAEELAVIEAKTQEIEDLEKKIETLKKAEQVRARQALPADESTEEVTTPAAPKTVKPEQQVSLAAAATVKSFATKQPVLKVLEDEGYGQLAKEIAAGAKTRNSPNTPTVDTGIAQVFIPTVITTPFIDMLYPTTTFFQGGPKRVQFTSGKYTQPRKVLSGQATYVGEGQRKPLTSPDFDQIEMVAKKLTAITPLTMEAMNWSIVNLESAIRSDLSGAFQRKIDSQAYFGIGSSVAPTGILGMSGIGSFTASSYVNAGRLTKPQIVEVDAAAAALILSLTTQNVARTPSWAWLMSYRTYQYLCDLRVGDTTGIYAYPELRNITNPTWKGIRVLVSNQVPDNGGGTGDESVLALIDFKHVLYGEEEGFTLKTSSEATLFDGTTTIYLWQQNMFAVLAEAQHNWTLEHPEAVAKMTGVRWGSPVGSP